MSVPGLCVPERLRILLIVRPLQAVATTSGTIGIIAMVSVRVAALLLVTAGSALAQGIETRVMVRVLAHDAKLIGSSVGGATVVIRDATTGAVLAEGLVEGSTGSTERIMIQPRERGAVIYDTPRAAGFLATLMLEGPTVVDIVAEGPLGTPQSTQRASKRMLLLPGEHVLGDGVVLEIHGFTVTILAPDSSATLHSNTNLAVRAKVGMT